MVHSKIAIIITAAGSSTRIGGNIKKEYLSYKNGTVLSNCAMAFLKADYSFNFLNSPYYSENKKTLFEISNFIITYPVGGRELSENALFSDRMFIELLDKHKNVSVDFIEGGQTRQKSVFNALEAVKNSGKNPYIVLIHDGARPFVAESVIRNVLAASVEFGAAVPGITPVDTQKEIDEQGFVLRHLVRKNLCAVQTPQGFEFEKLYEAHKKAESDNIINLREFTDDTEIWGEYCGAVKTVPGDVNNIKITYPSDLERL